MKGEGSLLKGSLFSWRIPRGHDFAALLHNSECRKFWEQEGEGSKRCFPVSSSLPSKKPQTMWQLPWHFLGKVLPFSQRDGSRSQNALVYLRLGACRPALGVLNSALPSNLPGVTGQAHSPSGFGWENEAMAKGLDLMQVWQEAVEGFKHTGNIIRLRVERATLCTKVQVLQVKHWHQLGRGQGGPQIKEAREAQWII